MRYCKKSTMKQTDAFRSTDLVSSLTARLGQAVTRPIKIMEVCGSHTMSIFHHGIRDLLPADMQLLSGPGCPVCVTPQGYIDNAIGLVHSQDVILASFGDMLRVPGNRSSLLKEKAAGQDIRVLYSPLDAVEIAATNPQRQVVFLGVGFETTAPVVAVTILEAAKRTLDNFSVFSAHKLVPPAMEALGVQHAGQSHAGTLGGRPRPGTRSPDSGRTGTRPSWPRPVAGRRHGRVRRLLGWHEGRHTV